MQLGEARAVPVHDFVGDEDMLALVRIELRPLVPLAEVLHGEGVEPELLLKLGDQPVARVGHADPDQRAGLGDQSIDLVDPRDRALVDRSIGMTGEDDDRVVGFGAHGERSVARGRLEAGRAKP